MTRRRRRPRPTPLKKGRVPSNTGPVTVTIESVGGRGDGTAGTDVRIDGETRKRVVFVPYTLAGEQVRAQPVADRGEGIVATPIELLTTSQDRVEPPCPHFMACGGCALQHWRLEPYRAWKVDQIRHHLGRAGVEIPAMEPLAASATGSRRRATFAVRRTKTRTVVGFHQRAGTLIEPIESCSVLMDDLVATLAPLRDAFHVCLAVGDTASVSINRLDTGLDMLVTVPRGPSLREREIWADLAERCDLARLSMRIEDDALAPEPLAVRRPATIRLGATDVTPPPGAFLQATAEGEAAIRNAVLKAATGSGSRLDLFAGIGTLALPLTAGESVRAVDGDEMAIGSLRKAADAAGLGGRLATEVRDLFGRPLEGTELQGVELAVVDPPRAGAKAQCEALASSEIPTVASVSCNPATFARDAAILVAGGYRLELVQPIDQFLWSPHIELAAVFRR